MLDILMITYKSERFEQLAIQSIQQNTDVPWHLTVTDNNAANISITRIWNEYARRSSADFLCFVNPDIYCAQGWASRLLEAYAHPDIMIATPSTPLNPRSPGYPCSRRQALLVDGVFNERGQVDVGRLNWLGTVLPPVIVDDPHAHGFCYCVRRDWFLQFGLFDEAFVYYTQELDLNYRAIRAGKRVVCVKNAVVAHFGQGSSGGSRTPELKLANQQGMTLLYRKHPEWRALFGLF